MIIMNKAALKDMLGWGIVLWLIGYILGIVLFAFVSPDILGWIIMPIGVIITLFIVFKKIKGASLKYYFTLGVAWTLIAIIFDYIFIVLAFGSSGYYKPDIYIYYALTFLLPLIAGWRKSAKKI
jgi:hypothetical protein